MSALPFLIGALCVMALAYRFYGAFLAAKVAALDDRRTTPAHTLKDGKDYDPTNRFVLFGHHFAAIAGAGPLIGSGSCPGSCGCSSGPSWPARSTTS
jgi:carbon starvation protein